MSLELQKKPRNLGIKNNHRGNQQKEQFLDNAEQCAVCKKISYLKCMKCETIYCSADCQVKDWPTHKLLHQGKNAFPSKSTNGGLRKSSNQTSSAIRNKTENFKAVNSNGNLHGHVSVQNRLKTAAEKDDSMKSKSKKFMETVFVPISEFDTEGYGNVVVSDIVKDANVFTYSVVPSYFYEASQQYQLLLQSRYEESENFVKIEDLKTFPSLVMAKIEGIWTRCRCLRGYDNANLIAAEEIDFGRKTVLNNQTVLKTPMDDDYTLPGFVFKMSIFEDIHAEVDDIIQIHKDVEMLGDKFLVHAKLKRMFSKDLNFMPFDEGIQDVAVVGTSFMKIGKIHLCQATVENFNFYNNLKRIIEEYVNNLKDHINYKPEIDEIVLARFCDGTFLRSIVNEITDHSLKVTSIDYGYKEEVGNFDILKIRRELVEEVPVVSQTFTFMLRNQIPIDDIHVKKTQENFETQKRITVKMQKQDDRLVVKCQEKDFIMRD